MPTTPEKVVVAMSGGVDSSVAAALLVEQGYDVMGLFMRVGAAEADSVGEQASETPRGLKPAAREAGHDVSPALKPAARESGHDASSVTKATRSARAHQGCCSASDAADARFVAGMLDIPFYALNFQKDFDEIIDYFADEYVRGRTPNPCVVCNDRLKFGKLLDYADAVGAKYVATGHYARIDRSAGAPRLLRGRDARKDQSYVLFGIGRAVLNRIMFPIGHLTKDYVREVATRLNLPNRDKPDSVEICFVPDRDYARVVKQRRPDAFAEGDVVDAGGRVVGRHKGIGHYTIGQRRGLGIAAGHPIYVTQLDVLNNRITVGEGDDLLALGLVAARANFLIDEPADSFRADVKIRYLHKAVPATVRPLGEGRVQVAFDEPQRAVTPGQAVVFYDGDAVVGGAWIEAAE